MPPYAQNGLTFITTEQAFHSVAVPVAWAATAVVLIVRALPLVLMNLRSFLRALAYAIISCAVLNFVFIADLVVVAGASDQSAMRELRPPRQKLMHRLSLARRPRPCPGAGDRGLAVHGRG